MSSSSLRYLIIAYITTNRGSTSGNRKPDAGTQVGVRGPSTISLAVAVNVTTLPPRVFASSTMLSSWSITGAVVSVMVTVNVIVVTALPSLSLTSQLTVVVPLGNRKPDAGTQVGVRGPSTISLAVAVNVTTLPPRVFASSTMLSQLVDNRSSCVCNGYCKCHRR